MLRLRSLLAAAATAAVVAGCSGGANRAAPTTSSTAAGPATTVRPVDTSFTGQSSAQFCELARTYNDRFTRVAANPSPAELRTVTREGQAAIAAAVGAAPPEIKPDVEVLSRAFSAVLAELERAGFDPAQVPVSAFTQLQSPEFERSAARFQAYIQSVCKAG